MIEATQWVHSEIDQAAWLPYSELWIHEYGNLNHPIFKTKSSWRFRIVLQYRSEKLYEMIKVQSLTNNQFNCLRSVIFNLHTKCLSSGASSDSLVFHGEL